MPGRGARFALVTAVTAAIALPGPALPAAATATQWDPQRPDRHLAQHPHLAQAQAQQRPQLAQTEQGACSTPLAPVEPVIDVPWAQQRYAPDRLTPFATGSGVTVAVIDSGVDDAHVQLKDRVLTGADYLDSGRDGTLDCPGHGTAVASIIAATPRSGIGFRGLAPKARILPVRISEQLIIDGKESGRTVTPAEFAAAIRWSVERGADVLNLSVVLYEDEPAVRSAIEYAVEEDVVVVAAAGNLHENGDPRPYPASYDGVVGVGAIGADGLRAPFSQVGSYVDVVAPGGAVLTAAPRRGHREQDGTSYATPFVSATAALVREYRPGLTAAQVIERIVTTADPAPGGGGSEAYGSGVLNPYRAVTETPAVRASPPAAVLPRSGPDPATVAAAVRRSQSRERALWLAGAAGGAAALAVLLAVVLPRGARRRWRPAGPD